MARMVRKQIYIDDRQDRILKREAEKTGLTESELVRRAIERAYDAEAAQEERMRKWARFEELADDTARRIADGGEEIIITKEDIRGGRY